jgi:hypothetical protein
MSATTVPSFLAVGPRPFVISSTPAPPSSGIGTGGAIAIGVGIVVLGLGILYAMERRPGWYVELYNYPVGDPNRRLKGYRGPYPSREEAVAVARTQLGTWVPKVAYSDVPPR